MEWSRPPISLAGAPQVTPSGLTHRYLTDPDFARRIYGAHWEDPAALESVVAAVRSRSYPRAELADTLVRQNEDWGMTGETAVMIDRIRDGAVTVITGQQVGLFSGPLYTIYKALAAIAWAKRIEEQTGTPAVPVFWLAGDDHDFDEINHVVIPGADGTPSTLRCDKADVPGARVSRLHLCDDVPAGIDRIEEALAEEPHAAGVLGQLRAAYRPGETWVDACARLLTGWLGQFGLVFVNPDDGELKRLMAPVFQAEIESPVTSRDLIAQRDTELRDAGYAPQVGHTEGATLLFVDAEDGTRRRVDYSDARFTWTSSEPVASPADMTALFDASPERFSANALLRPVSADVAFPTVMHIMGPGEIAYMAQARMLYERHDVPMPVVVPRASFTVVEPEIADLLDEQHFSVAEALRRPDDLVGDRARKAYAGHEGTINALRERVDAAYAEAADAIAEDLPGIRTAALSAQIKTHSLLGRLERKVLQELRREQSASRPDLRKIADALYPNGKPQERVYPVLPQVARYGGEWFGALLDLLTDDPVTHRAVYPRT